jgi:hypothetical protein
MVSRDIQLIVIILLYINRLRSILVQDCPRSGRDWYETTRSTFNRITAAAAAANKRLLQIEMVFFHYDGNYIVYLEPTRKIKPI